MLPSVKFVEDKVLAFVILGERCKKQCDFKSNPNQNPNFQSRLIRQIGVVLSNGILLSNKYG